jgi:plasmid stabilization system protein ParE
MKLIVSPLAARRLRDIQAHIALEGNLPAALRVVLRIRQAAEMLTDFPRIGPVWHGGPSRVLVVSGLPYRIHYRILADAVEILTIAHTSQKPQKFG